MTFRFVLCMMGSIRGYDEYFIITAFNSILYCGIDFFIGKVGFVRYSQKQSALFGDFIISDLFGIIGRASVFKENYLWKGKIKWQIQKI